MACKQLPRCAADRNQSTELSCTHQRLSAARNHHDRVLEGLEDRQVEARGEKDEAQGEHLRVAWGCALHGGCELAWGFVSLRGVLSLHGVEF